MKRARDTATSMGWMVPWYSAQGSLDTLLVGRRGGGMHIVRYFREPVARPDEGICRR